MRTDQLSSRSARSRCTPMFLFSLQTLARKRGRLLAPERIARIREGRLRSLVRHAVRGSAYYREKYRGIDPDRFELEDLPPTNKAELMADFDRTVTDPAVTREGLVRFMDDP